MIVARVPRQWCLKYIYNHCHNESLVRSHRLFTTTTSLGTSDTGTGAQSSEPSQDIDHYDIVINGGGVVGFTLLAALSKNPQFSDKRIILLEQQTRKSPPGHQFTEQSVGVDLVASERRISNRVSSITKSSKEFYDNNLNVWKSIASFVKECKSMHVWSDNYNHGVTFMPRYPGLSDLTCPYWEPSSVPDENVCYFVENHRLLESLERIVPMTMVNYGTSVTDITSFGNLVDVHVQPKDGNNLDANKVIRTNLVIGCDGYNSIVRSKSNLKYFSHDLKQKGIVGTVEMVNPKESTDKEYSDSDLNSIAFQRFLPEDNSVIALLPISDNYSSIVISTSETRAEKLMSLSDDDFVNELNDLLNKKSIQKPIKATIKSAIDNIINNTPFARKGTLPPSMNPPMVSSLVPNSRGAFPLMFGSTLPYATGHCIKSVQKTVPANVLKRRTHGCNLVLIGDALHRVPPLAGQGLNLGIGDAIELVNCLSESLERGENLFPTVDTSDGMVSNESLTKSLDKFEKRRMVKLVPMMAAIMSMSNVFTTVPTSLINQFNQFNLIKNEIVKFANSR